MPVRHAAGAILALTLVVAACGGAAAPGTTAPSGGTGAPTPPVGFLPTPVPGSSGVPGVGQPGSGAGGGAGGSGGGSEPGAGGGSQPGNPGGGTQPGNPGGGPFPIEPAPVPIQPGPGGVDPGVPVDPEPSIVVPVAGLTGIRDVAAMKLQASVSGRDVAVRVAWWSGVEPCSVLAGVNVVRDGKTITLTVREGTGGAGDVMCIEIAVYKATIVDLGTLEPGTWTIRANGEALPIEVTIPG